MKKNNIILLFLVAAASCFSQDQLKIIDNNIKTKLKKFPTVGIVVGIYKMKNIFLILLLIICTVLHGQKTIKINKSEKEFEKFWTTFKDNYAFFKLKNVDWGNTYKNFKSKVNSKTTETELIKIFG